MAAPRASKAKVGLNKAQRGGWQSISLLTVEIKDLRSLAVNRHVRRGIGNLQRLGLATIVNLIRQEGL
jgi:hypothetical protein